jgi:hypothetical protein
VLDADSSCILVDQAMRIVFRTFDSVCKQNKTIRKLKDTDKLKQFDELEAAKRPEFVQKITNKVNFKAVSTESPKQPEESALAALQRNLIRIEKMIDRKQIYQQIPREWYEEIRLPEFLRVPSHPCMLTRSKKGVETWRNACNTIRDIKHCVNNLENFNPHHHEFWRCQRCDYDICRECAQLSLFVDKHLTANFDLQAWSDLKAEQKRGVLPDGLLRDFPHQNWIQSGIKPGEDFCRCDEGTGSKWYNDYCCNSDGNQNCRWYASRGNRGISCRAYPCFRTSA